MESFGGPSRELFGFPHGYRAIALTTMGLHRCPDPERFISLGSDLGPDKDVIPLTSLSSRGQIEREWKMQPKPTVMGTPLTQVLPSREE